MIIDLVVTIMIMVGAVFPAMLLYDLVESHFTKYVILLGYCLLCLGMMVNFLVDFIIYQLS